MKATAELLTELTHIRERIDRLAADRDRHELDTDAVVELHLARESVEKLINRVERIVK
jgi:hypothetical protein